MELSLNEIEVTAVKAARGRGLDHGIAAEVGAAARWLCEEGQDGIAAVAEALADDDCTADRLGLGAVDLALATTEPVAVFTCVSNLLLAGLAGRVGLIVSEEPGGLRVKRSTAELEHVVQAIAVPAPSCWAQIEEWAAQTYVPSSEESRTAGAGAGLTDND